MPAKQQLLLPGVSGRAETAAQAASGSTVGLFRVSRCHRRDVGGYEIVVLMLNINLEVKT